MRPRSLTVMPWERAHSRISPARPEPAEARLRRLDPPRPPPFRAAPTNGAKASRNAAECWVQTSISYDVPFTEKETDSSAGVSSSWISQTRRTCTRWATQTHHPLTNAKKLGANENARRAEIASDVIRRPLLRLGERVALGLSEPARQHPDSSLRDLRVGANQRLEVPRRERERAQR